MSECAPDAFAMANRTETPMNVVAVVQHTSGEYLGLMEDHLEGRRIRFQYFRPFAGGRKLPAKDLPADALVLLGGGPWGSAGGRDLPTLSEEIELTQAMLEQDTPVIGIGLGAQILAIAAGGSSEPAELVFECRQAELALQLCAGRPPAPSRPERVAGGLHRKAARASAADAPRARDSPPAARPRALPDAPSSSVRCQPASAQGVRP